MLNLLVGQEISKVEMGVKRAVVTVDAVRLVADGVEDFVIVIAGGGWATIIPVVGTIFEAAGVLPSLGAAFCGTEDAAFVVVPVFGPAFDCSRCHFDFDMRDEGADLESEEMKRKNEHTVLVVRDVEIGVESEKMKRKNELTALVVRDVEAGLESEKTKRKNEHTALVVRDEGAGLKSEKMKGKRKNEHTALLL